MRQHSGALVLPPPIGHFLRRTRQRMRARRALIGAGYGLSAGLGVGIAVALAARLWPLLSPGQLLAALLGALAGGATLGALVAAARPLPLRAVAARCDRELGLRERLGTALELADGTTHSALAARQLDETADAIAGRRPSSPIWPRPERRPALATLGLLAALATLVFAPNGQEAERQRQAANQQVVRQAAQGVAQVEAKVRERDDLDPETKRALERQLEQLRQDLADGTLAPSDAVARIAEAEAQLRPLQDPSAGKRAEALPRLAEELTPFGLTADAGRRLAAGDHAGAGQALKDVAAQLPNLDQGSRQALAQKLREAATSQAATNPELAKRLQEAADALDRGDLAGAQAALSGAGDAVAQAGQGVATQQGLGEALGDLGAIKLDVANGQLPTTANGTPQPLGGTPIALNGTPVRISGTAGAGNGTPAIGVAQGGGQGAGQGQGQGQGQGSGQGSGQSQGAGQGQGQNQGQAQGAGGSGYSAGGSGASRQQSGATAPGGNPAGGQAVPPPPPSTYDSVYAPSLPGGAPGQREQVSGSGGQDTPPSGTTQGPGANAPATVPYNEVYEQYRDAALSGLDDGSIPPEYREYIRQYFSELDPSKR